MIVIAIIGAIAAMAWPSLFGAVGRENLDESARRIKTAVCMCRAQAMNEARNYRISFLQDGRLRVSRQRDALLAADQYEAVRDSWVTYPLTLDDVWVAELQPMPLGPPPINVEDNLIEFPPENESLTRIEALEQPYHLDFEPDGSSQSARFVLRDKRGRGLKVTLDGRLGRVTMEPVETVKDAARPEALPEPNDLVGPNEPLPTRVGGGAR